MMSEEEAQQAAHAHSQAVVDGVWGAMIRGMTPEGLAKSIEVASPTVNNSSYDLTSAGRDEDAYVFHVTYHTAHGPLALRERFRKIDGEWKLVDIERIA